MLFSLWVSMQISSTTYRRIEYRSSQNFLLLEIANMLQVYNNNSIQFFIIYVPSQQPQGQLQTQHSVDKNNYFMNKNNIKSKTS
jgi:hypothetical protein